MAYKAKSLCQKEANQLVSWQKEMSLTLEANQATLEAIAFLISQGQANPSQATVEAIVFLTSSYK